MDLWQGERPRLCPPAPRMDAARVPTTAAHGHGRLKREEGSSAWDADPTRRAMRWKASLHPAVMDAAVRTGARLAWTVRDGCLRLSKDEYLVWHKLAWDALSGDEVAGWSDSAEDDWENDRARGEAGKALWQPRHDTFLAAVHAGAGDADKQDLTFFQFCAGAVELADRWTASAAPGEAVMLLDRIASSGAPVA